MFVSWLCVCVWRHWTLSWRLDAKSPWQRIRLRRWPNMGYSSSPRFTASDIPISPDKFFPALPPYDERFRWTGVSGFSELQTLMVNRLPWQASDHVTTEDINCRRSSRLILSSNVTCHRSGACESVALLTKQHNDNNDTLTYKNVILFKTFSSRSLLYVPTTTCWKSPKINVLAYSICRRFVFLSVWFTGFVHTTSDKLNTRQNYWCKHIGFSGGSFIVQFIGPHHVILNRKVLFYINYVCEPI